jgi:LysR family cys regulon transcriptional activator
MTLQQLRFLAAIFESDFNITAAAAKLRTTQPAVSRQLLLLERELGFTIFSRNGSAFSRVTPAGERVIEYARRALREAQNIKDVSAEIIDPRRGELRVGATHTEARYALPPVIRQFQTLFPGVRFSLHQGTPEQIADMARGNRIQLAMATDSDELFSPFVRLPCYRWHRRLLVPPSHPLAGSTRPSVEQLSAHAIAEHLLDASDASTVHEVFARAGVEARVALTAQDAEIVKTYVRLGHGVGIIADAALDVERDQDLVSIDASHLFPAHTTWVGFIRGSILREYMYEFLAMLAPHLNRERIARAHGCQTQAEIDTLFREDQHFSVTKV